MTSWFERRPGDLVSPSTEDETMSLVGDAPPDWVRLPEALGGGQSRVLGARLAPCPRCSGDCRHLDLEGHYGVAECLGDGFLWYRRSGDTR